MTNRNLDLKQFIMEGIVGDGRIFTNLGCQPFCQHQDFHWFIVPFLSTAHRQSWSLHVIAGGLSMWHCLGRYLLDHDADPRSGSTFGDAEGATALWQAPGKRCHHRGPCAKTLPLHAIANKLESKNIKKIYQLGLVADRGFPGKNQFAIPFENKKCKERCKDRCS